MSSLLKKIKKGIFGNNKKDKSQKRRKKRSSRKKENMSATDADASAAFDGFVAEEIEIGGVPDNFHQEIRPERSKKPIRRRVNWMEVIRFQSVWLGLWAILVISAIVFRVSFLPDESLLLATAWDSSFTGNTFLLNSDPRTGMQAAPLFIWLLQFGWGMLGFVEWLPGVLAAVFGLLSLSVVSLMAKRMWPLEDEVSLYAPLIALGCFVWAIDLTLISSHMAHLFFVCMSMYSLIMMRDQVRLSWVFFGLFSALGAMTGGLVSFVYTMPVALLGPVWLAREVTAGYWYKKLFLAIIVAAIICGAWLFPVYSKLGMVDFVPFLKSSLLPETMVMFESEKPGWWYLFVLPLMLFPWTLWPLVWKRFAGLRNFKDHGGVGFVFTWMFSTLFILSFFETKQAHLLIPVLPSIVLFTSYLLLRRDFCADKDHESPFSSMGFPIIVLGGILATIPNISRIEALPEFLWNFSPVVGFGVSFVGIALAWMPVKKMKQQVTNIAIFSLMSSVFLIMWAWWQFGPSYQVEEISKALAKADGKGMSIAHVGEYNSQYEYQGRLLRRIKEIDKKEVNGWLAKNPDGLLIASEWIFNPQDVPEIEPLLKSSYQGNDVMLWPVSDIIKALVKATSSNS